MKALRDSRVRFKRFHLIHRSRKAAAAAGAEQGDRFLTQAETGEPYDVDNMPQEPFAYAFWLVVCLAIGFVIALITASIKRSKLTSVVKRTTAEEYMKKESLAKHILPVR